MNPLHPSPRLLRRIAQTVGASDDPAICAWAVAMNHMPKPTRRPEFAGVSVVRTYRDGRFAGYEVWRHLYSHRLDPKRRKARLWFGRTRYGPKKCYALARAAAFRMERMTSRELREWWAEYKAARNARRSVSNLWRDEAPELVPVFEEFHST